jgi:hypothetical protein
MRRVLPLAVLLAALAGAARAETDPLRAAVFANAPSTRPAPTAAVAYADAPAPRPAGIAKTSLDHAFDKGASAQAGFLCGLDARKDSRGAMAAYGADPQGRFLGAKLRLTFR